MSKYIYFSEKNLKMLGILDFTGVKWNGACQTVAIIILFASFFGAGIYNLTNVADDFGLLTDNFCILVISTTSYTKFAALIVNREKIRVLKNIVRDDEISVAQSENEESVTIETHARFALKFCKAYSGLIFISGQGMLILPLIGVFLGGEYQLPFPADYPFSINSTGMYTIAYIHQVLGTYFILLILISFSSLFIFLIHYACDHFCVLQNLLENISEVDRQHVQEKITRCVRLHQNLFEFSERIEEVFNVTLLVQFLLSSVMICVSGYIATKNFDKPQLLVKHVPILITQIMELLIFNWCGQMMEEKSYGVSLAVSRCEFYKLKIEHQRDLGFILLRAQKPAYITAGKFYNLSLLNFTNLMKASFSYFTMLTSFDEI